VEVGTVSPDVVAPSQIVGVSASVDLSLHHKVQKFSAGTGSPWWSRKRAVKRLLLLYPQRLSSKKRWRKRTRGTKEKDTRNQLTPAHLEKGH